MLLYCRDERNIVLDIECLGLWVPVDACDFIADFFEFGGPVGGEVGGSPPSVVMLHDIYFSSISP